MLAHLALAATLTAPPDLINPGFERACVSTDAPATYKLDFLPDRVHLIVNGCVAPNPGGDFLDGGPVSFADNFTVFKITGKCVGDQFNVPQGNCAKQEIYSTTYISPGYWDNALVELPSPPGCGPEQADVYQGRTLVYVPLTGTPDNQIAQIFHRTCAVPVKPKPKPVAPPVVATKPVTPVVAAPVPTSPQLPFTGADTGLEVTLGGVLVALGGALVALRRKVRS